MWLLDTNVISESAKGPRRHPQFGHWWSTIEGDALFLSVMTLGEIRKGIEKVRPRDFAKAVALELWLHDLEEAFGPRIMPVTPLIAGIWGRLAAARSAPVVDTLLAATAVAHDLTLVTRNIADVAGFGARLLDPFAPAVAP